MDEDGARPSLAASVAVAAVMALAVTAASAPHGVTPQGASAASDCAPDNGGLTLPEGFCATIFADGLGHARHVVVAPNGDVYANTWSHELYYPNSPPPPGGFLVALRDTNGDGRADTTARFGDTPARGGTGGTGIGLHRGALYAEAGSRIVRYRLAPGRLVPSGQPETIVSGLPTTGEHPTHPFAIESTGDLYVNSGTMSNSCQVRNRTLESPGQRPCAELETRGGIWQFDANRTGQAFSSAARFATGIRNAVGIAVGPDGALYATQHGRDQLAEHWPKLYTPEQGAELPAEELLRVERGGDYGWPFCYYDHTQQKRVLAPEYGGDGGKAVGECAANKGPVVASFPAHWAPNGLLFYGGTQFPARYRGGAFIAFHGSWNRAPFPQAGYQVAFVRFEGGKPSGGYETFADGFAGGRPDPAAAAHRPVGLAQGPDGALYVTDDRSGRVWRVVYRGAPDRGSGFGARGSRGLAEPRTPSPEPRLGAKVTGRTVEVRMIGDESGYRYEPAHVTIRPGDAVRWMMVSGGPHDVAFSEATLPEAGRAQLRVNMPDQRQPFGSPFFMTAGEAYSVSFGGAAPGRYNYYCTPHLMMGMAGSITVQSDQP